MEGVHECRCHHNGQTCHQGGLCHQTGLGKMPVENRQGKKETSSFRQVGMDSPC